MVLTTQGTAKMPYGLSELFRLSHQEKGQPSGSKDTLAIWRWVAKSSMAPTRSGESGMVITSINSQKQPCIE